MSRVTVTFGSCTGRLVLAGRGLLSSRLSIARTKARILTLGFGHDPTPHPPFAVKVPLSGLFGPNECLELLEGVLVDDLEIIRADGQTKFGLPLTVVKDVNVEQVVTLWTDAQVLAYGDDEVAVEDRRRNIWALMLPVLLGEVYGFFVNHTERSGAGAVANDLRKVIYCELHELVVSKPPAVQESWRFKGRGAGGDEIVWQ